MTIRSKDVCLKCEFYEKYEGKDNCKKWMFANEETRLSGVDGKYHGIKVGGNLPEFCHFKKEHVIVSG